MKTTKNKKVVLRQIILHTSHEIHQRSSNFLKMINGVYNFDLFYAHTKKGKKRYSEKKEISPFMIALVYVDIDCAFIKNFPRKMSKML